MVKKPKDVVKDVVKHKPAPKSTFGTNPRDPWSAKANIDENVTSRRADLLSKFYKSRGWNVDYISKNKKVSQSKTGDYEKWKRDHGIYEQDVVEQPEQIDEISDKALQSYRSKAHTQIQHYKYAGGKDKPEASKVLAKREPGMKTATDKVIKKEKERIAALPKREPEMLQPYKPLGGRDEKSGRSYSEEVNVGTSSLNTEARMSASVKLQRAWERQRAKSDASKKRGDEYMAQIRQQVADKQKKEVKEDNFQDPKAATQCAFDGANNPGDTIPSKKMSKAAKMVKELHDRKLTEDMYDWEKSDKQGEQYGKAPKVKKTDGVNEIGDTKPNARMVLKGGTTLTGQSRDTVEIDPMLKNRTSMPDYKSMDQKKTKPQDQ